MVRERAPRLTRATECIFKELTSTQRGSRSSIMMCSCQAIISYPHLLSRTLSAAGLLRAHTEVCGTHASIHLAAERGHRGQLECESSVTSTQKEKGLPLHFSSARPCLVSSCSSLPTPSPSLPMTAFFCYLPPRRASLSPPSAVPAVCLFSSSL